MSAESTMSAREIAKWEAQFTQKVVAQREHARRYKGHPGTPHTIRPERNVKPVQKPLSDACIHKWRLIEPNGTAMVSGLCGYCGATRDFPSSFDEGTTKVWERRL